MTLTISPLAGVVLAMLYIRLAFNVIRLRRGHRVSLGSGEHSDLEKAIRTHGNFAEYVPMTLALLIMAEINGAHWAVLLLAAALVIVGRVLHAKGITTPPPDFTNRVRGMKLTFGALGLLAVLNLVLVFRQLV